MNCSVHIAREGATVVARCAELAECEGRGATRDEALARLRASITFWLESCPCDVTAAPGLTLAIVRDTA
jgi:predicted RNase H-like HicB family nuclease